MSENFVEKAVLDECRTSVKEEIDDIRETVHLVKEMKQDRVKPMLLIAILTPIFLWMMGTSVTGLIWGTGLTAQVNYLQKLNEVATVDRYYGSDAERDFALRDLKINNLQRHVEENSKMIEDLRKKHSQ